MKKTKLLIGLGALASSLTIPFISASCGSKKPDNEDLSKTWDKDIVIGCNWINDGFLKTDKETKFLEKLSEKFEAEKNKDELAKKQEKVTFRFAEKKSKKKVMFSDLKANKNIDLAPFSYWVVYNDMENNKISISDVDKFELKRIAQAKQLKFAWHTDNSVTYKDGTANDPLRKIAAEENKLQFETHGEFQNWKDKKDALKWDGSKYGLFYKENKSENLTFVLRGSIIISGDDATRAKITKAWDDKNFDEFMKNGVCFESYDSHSNFKYQVALISRHFGKTIDEVIKFIKDNEKYVNFSDNGVASLIGNKNSTGTVCNIAFDNEGAFNWSPAHESWTSTFYNPVDKNAKIRVLTVTNPAPYDLLLGRSGLSNKQAELISKALTSLTLEENTYGVYTGYNLFKPIDNQFFTKMLKLQEFAKSANPYGTEETNFLSTLDTL
ncbi:ABC transporter thiamine pyrophosphate-binding lipoprotein p37/Cypl [Mycoplasmopsis primatum]|uniref:ABC transporter thiamine pyrophosphate-binding lipoprotein p37/Cypl n=1 Tax=Mycoplasmopsis primatum TaxID=55604 RepID=UPI0004979712|nr:variable surface lipoprotein [Mycoplasmopsis primatum]